MRGIKRNYCEYMPEFNKKHKLNNALEEVQINNDPKQQYELGLLYEKYGDDDEADFWFRCSASNPNEINGYIPAQYKLGDKNHKWMLLCAHQNYLHAQYRIGENYYNAKCATDRTAILDKIQLLRNDVENENRRASRRENNKIDHTNYEEMRYWFKMCLNNPKFKDDYFENVSFVYYAIGLSYYIKGKNSKNYSKAIPLFLQSARDGCCLAQYKLGKLAIERKDIDEAVNFYTLILNNNDTLRYHADRMIADVKAYIGYHYYKNKIYPEKGIVMMRSSEYYYKTQNRFYDYELPTGYTCPSYSKSISGSRLYNIDTTDYGKNMIKNVDEKICHIVMTNINKKLEKYFNADVISVIFGYINIDGKVINGFNDNIITYNEIYNQVNLFE